MSKTILYLTANPCDTQYLAELGGEIRDIKREIRNSKYGNHFRFEVLYAACAEDILHGMMEIQPHIVHFSGHGGNDGIIIDDGKGYSDLVTSNALKDFFGQFDHIECIVLNACYSSSQAEILRSVVKYVVGISGVVEDKIAAKFASSFYNAIGNGLSVDSAFTLSRSYLNLSENSRGIELVLLQTEENTALSSTLPAHGPVSISEPINNLFSDIRDVVIKYFGPRATDHGIHLREIGTLYIQWVVACILGLTIAAVISTGPANLLFKMFGASASLTLPLLQWQTIKHWARNLSWLQWVFFTILGWSIGLYIGNQIDISNYLNISPYGVIHLNGESSLGGTAEDNYSDTDIIFLASKLYIGLLMGSFVVSIVQSYLLKRSFLRVKQLSWVWANVSGMILGGILGLPILLIYSELLNTRPDDLLFAVIIGVTYGLVTGRSLFSFTSSEQISRLNVVQPSDARNTNISHSATNRDNLVTSNPGFETGETEKAGLSANLKLRLFATTIVAASIVGRITGITSVEIVTNVFFAAIAVVGFFALLSYPLYWIMNNVASAFHAEVNASNVTANVNNARNVGRVKLMLFGVVIVVARIFDSSGSEYISFKTVSDVLMVAIALIGFLTLVSYPVYWIINVVTNVYQMEPNTDDDASYVQKDHYAGRRKLILLGVIIIICRIFDISSTEYISFITVSDVLMAAVAATGFLALVSYPIYWGTLLLPLNKRRRLQYNQTQHQK